ncbi:MAG: hypothetical protein QNL96_02220 [SAR86 cluster bacterium]
MADINIENFYRHIAVALNLLYSNFPSKFALYVDEIAGIDEPDEYGLHSPRYTSGFFALLWLEEEGYMRFVDTIREDGVDQACLTHKEFLKLSAACDPIYVEPTLGNTSKVSSIDPSVGLSPSVIEERKLVISQLRRALRSGSSIAVNKIIQQFLHT